MTYDIYLVVGIVVLVLTIPSIVSAIFDGRAPRYSAIMVLIGGGLVAVAVSQNPTGYTIQDIPGAFTRVIGYVLR
ncbi:MAG TPA: hypothetical protein ENK28_04305 [Aliiroseovarius sp.]|nr:hypothetical protein [Aliiroseovarius sp.]